VRISSLQGTSSSSRLNNLCTLTHRNLGLRGSEADGGGHPCFLPAAYKVPCINKKQCLCMAVFQEKIPDHSTEQILPAQAPPPITLRRSTKYRLPRTNHQSPHSRAIPKNPNGPCSKTPLDTTCQFAHHRRFLCTWHCHQHTHHFP
jgi:hypothetical protein